MSGVRHIVTGLEALRQAVQNEESPKRVATLRGDDVVNRILITPVEQALNGTKLRPDEVEVFDRALDRSLAALTHPDILSVVVH
jgi:hypothetical protein